jgi:putative membrane protein
MHRNEFLIWSLLMIAVMAIAFYGTADRVNWMLDACWVVVGVPLLLVTRKRFPLTPLLYRLMVIHALVLIGGGYWTYEEMPIGLWLQGLFHTQRNEYDRFGHFMQGFVPAIIFREIFVRCSPVKGGGWLVYFVLASCLAFSALFELIEWWAAVLSGAEGGEFLGHQGDIWDAQWDMLCAIFGSVTSLALLSRWHDRQLENLAHGNANRH